MPDDLGYELLIDNHGPSECSSANRYHHLLKTFYTGVTGWRDRQLVDGTIIWTSPTGHTYVTYPGSRQHFPKLCEPPPRCGPGNRPSSSRPVIVAR
jgi:hypothetical protein